MKTDLFNNLESIGINPVDCVLAMPMDEGSGNYVRDIISESQADIIGASWSSRGVETKLGEYISLPAFSSLFTDIANKFTICISAYRDFDDSVATEQGLFYFYRNNGNLVDIKYDYNNDIFSAKHLGGYNTAIATAPASTIPIGLHDIIMSVDTDKDKIAFYSDGVEIGSASGTKNIYGVVSVLKLGANRFKGWQGAIQSAVVFSRALSPEEISSIPSPLNKLFMPAEGSESEDIGGCISNMYGALNVHKSPRKSIGGNLVSMSGELNRKALFFRNLKGEI